MHSHAGYDWGHCPKLYTLYIGSLQEFMLNSIEFLSLSIALISFFLPPMHYWGAQMQEWVPQ